MLDQFAAHGGHSPQLDDLDAFHSPALINALVWRRRLLWLSVGVLALIALILVGGLAVVAARTLPPQPEALAALESDSAVQVTMTDGWIAFQPAGVAAETGLVLYPGGLVDPRAYAPQARAIADVGHALVVVPSMPLNLAVFDPDRAAAVMAAYPAVRFWAVGGHSLGGTMAARFVRRHRGAATALLLWASYPDQSDDLSAESELAVMSVSGTLDGLATPAEIEASRSLLPLSAEFVPIVGGNHAQFGWYGPQPGDNPATIPHLEQQHYTVEASVALLRSIEDATRTMLRR